MKMKALMEFCDLNMGQSPNSETYNEENIGLPFFQGNADFGEVYPKVRIWCSSPVKVAAVGDILISVRAPIGAMNIANTPCCIGRGLAALSPNPDTCMREYLYYALQSRIDWLIAQGTGSTFKAIGRKTLEGTQIPAYSLDEQQIISDTLSKTDQLITKAKAQASLLDELVKSRFVEMFGVMHSGVYETKKLREFCKFQQGTQVPIEEQIETQLEGYTRFLRIIDYTQAPQPPRYVSVKGKKIEEDSVVVVRYGATAGFVGHGYAGILANNLFEVIPDEATMSKEFLYLTLKHGTFEQEVHDKAFGAAMPALSFGMMNDIIVAVPSKQAQNEFIVFVKQVDKSKLAVKQSLEKLETLKKSLMQQYFG